MDSFESYGSCECGETQYSLTGEPLFVHVCHCVRCQKRTGTAFYITIMVLHHDFAITEGEPEFISTPLDSGALFGSYACQNCRDYLYHTHSGYPQIIMPTAGTLDDTSWVQPRAHIYTKSKQSWVEIPEGLPQFKEMYELANVWPKESLTRLAEINAIEADG